jgi:hypothetical protein
MPASRGRTQRPARSLPFALIKPSSFLFLFFLLLLLLTPPPPPPPPPRLGWAADCRARRLVQGRRQTCPSSTTPSHPTTSRLEWAADCRARRLVEGATAACSRRRRALCWSSHACRFGRLLQIVLSTAAEIDRRLRLRQESRGAAPRTQSPTTTLLRPALPRGNHTPSCKVQYCTCATAEEHPEQIPITLKQALPAPHVDVLQPQHPAHHFPPWALTSHQRHPIAIPRFHPALPPPCLLIVLLLRRRRLHKRRRRRCLLPPSHRMHPPPPNSTAQN